METFTLTTRLIEAAARNLITKEKDLTAEPYPHIRYKQL